MSNPTWDPDRYLRFADARTRPGVELITRIPDHRPERIVDLGSGTGHLTALLQRRWPASAVTGLDASPAMVDRARADHPGIDWVVGDIADWEPEGAVDLIFSNAALHWLDDHERLFTRLRSSVAPGGVIAVQMPDNWREPTHRVPAEILDDGTWPPDLVASLPRDRLASPATYRRLLQPASVDLWRTTYFQELTGPDPVWDWVSGSLLRPVIDRLGDGPDAARFEERCTSRYGAAYPPVDGVTVVAFSRLFVVATVPASPTG